MQLIVILVLCACVNLNLVNVFGNFQDANTCFMHVAFHGGSKNAEPSLFAQFVAESIQQ